MFNASNINIRAAFDLLIFIALFCFSLMYGMTYMRSHQDQKAFYSYQFSPSVAIACGRDFEHYSFKPQNKLNNFLNAKVNSFSCSNMPTNKKAQPITYFQHQEKYLMYSVGYIWKLFGVSWSSLNPFFALMFSISILACYGIFRLGLNPFYSVLGIVIIIYFDFFIPFLPSIRDFSPAIFCLSSLFFIGLLVKLKYNPWSFTTLSILAALTLGIGVGFRPDMLVYAPLAPLAILFFSQSKVLDHWRVKVITLILFFIIFTSLLIPIMYNIKTGSNLYHVIFEGYSPGFTQALNVLPSPNYSYLSFYSDGLTLKIISSFGYRILHVLQPIKLSTKLYDHIGAHFFLTIIFNYPADFIIRCLASVWQVLVLPYHLIILSYNKIHFISNCIFELIRFGSIILAALVLLVMQLSSKKHAFFCLICIIYLGAYPTLQFAPRHFFYLSFIGLWIFLCAIQFISKLTWGVILNKYDFSTQAILANTLSKRFLKILFIIFTFLIIVSLVIITSRLYQKYNLTKLYSSYLNLKMSELNYRVDRQKNIIHIIPEHVHFNNHFNTGDAYLVLQMKASNCYFPILYFQERYKYTPYLLKKKPQIAKTIPYISHPIMKFNIIGKSTIFLPIYNDEFRHFYDLILPNYDIKCISHIKQITNTNQTPLMFNLFLNQDWRNEPLYQTIGRTLTSPSGFPQELLTYPDNLVIPKALWHQKVIDSQIMKKDRIVHTVKSDIIVRGIPSSPSSYLLQLEPLTINKKDLKKYDYYFIAEGKLLSGAFQIGLLRNETWLHIILIKYQQPMNIIFNISQPGIYKPTIANYSADASYDLSFRKFGWVIIPKHSNKPSEYNAATKVQSSANTTLEHRRLD